MSASDAIQVLESLLSRTSLPRGFGAPKETIAASIRTDELRKKIADVDKLLDEQRRGHSASRAFRSGFMSTPQAAAFIRVRRIGRIQRGLGCSHSSTQYQKVNRHHYD